MALIIDARRLDAFLDENKHFAVLQVSTEIRGAILSETMIVSSLVYKVTLSGIGSMLYNVIIVRSLATLPSLRLIASLRALMRHVASVQEVMSLKNVKTRRTTKLTRLSVQIVLKVKAIKREVLQHRTKRRTACAHSMSGKLRR